MTQQITIIGVGLIGGSFALALKEAGFAGKIVGSGRSAENLNRAVERGIIDSWDSSLSSAVAGSDVVLVSTPVGTIDIIMQEMAPALGASTIVTDAGSVKQSIIHAAKNWMSSFENFVPAHPIAGTEHSGVEAGFASLYRGKRLIVTPVLKPWMLPTTMRCLLPPVICLICLPLVWSRHCIGWIRNLRYCITPVEVLPTTPGLLQAIR